jgi:hypothetical protein
MASNQFPITVPGISESSLCLGAFQQVGLGGEMGRGGVSSGVGQKQYEGGRHVKYHMVIRFWKMHLRHPIQISSRSPPYQVSHDLIDLHSSFNFQLREESDTRTSDDQEIFTHP